MNFENTLNLAGQVCSSTITLNLFLLFTLRNGCMVCGYFIFPNINNSVAFCFSTSLSTINILDTYNI